MGYGSCPASDSLCDPAPEGDTPVDKIHYLGMVMSVMYMARLTRADVLFPTTYLASKNQAPTTKNYNDLCRVLKYLEKAAMNNNEAEVDRILQEKTAHGVLKVHPMRF